eukprot:scaffold428_cov105-Isochrysis_galbana.AAC.4
MRHCMGHTRRLDRRGVYSRKASPNRTLCEKQVKGNTKRGIEYQKRNTGHWQATQAKRGNDYPCNAYCS